MIVLIGRKSHGFKSEKDGYWTTITRRIVAKAASDESVMKATFRCFMSKRLHGKCHAKNDQE